MLCTLYIGRAIVNVVDIYIYIYIWNLSEITAYVSHQQYYIWTLDIWIQFIIINRPKKYLICGINTAFDWIIGSVVINYWIYLCLKLDIQPTIKYILSGILPNLFTWKIKLKNINYSTIILQNVPNVIIYQTFNSGQKYRNIAHIITITYLFLL